MNVFLIKPETTDEVYEPWHDDMLEALWSSMPWRSFNWHVRSAKDAEARSPFLLAGLTDAVGRWAADLERKAYLG